MKILYAILFLLFLLLAFLLGYMTSYELVEEKTIMREIGRLELKVPQTRFKLNESIYYMNGRASITGIPKEKYRNRLILIFPEDTKFFDLVGNSMMPLQGIGSYAFNIPVEGCDVSIGDIVVFNKTKLKGGTFLGDSHLVGHRIIKEGEDKEGKYFITRGDNNIEDDEFKFRCKDIIYTQIGVMW